MTVLEMKRPGSFVSVGGNIYMKQIPRDAILQARADSSYVQRCHQFTQDMKSHNLHTYQAEDGAVWLNIYRNDFALVQGYTSVRLRVDNSAFGVEDDLVRVGPQQP